VKRKEEIIIPDGGTKLLEGDSVTIIGKRADVEKLIKKFTA
jgi:Trk K+ transport system NAD-binding subunit